MYKLDHAPDVLAQQAIQRRRRLDQERMKRIFDPKVRVLGIDVDGLEEQIKVKHELKGIERERNNMFDHAATNNNHILELLDRKVELARRQIAQQDNIFRMTLQQPQTRREFAHLNDPQMLQKDRPARLGDQDVTNTVSGLQKFEGEDLQEMERIRLQKEQMRKWTAEKTQERWEAKMNEDSLEQQRNELNAAVNCKVSQLMEYQRQCRRQQAESDVEYNRRLAEEKRLREQMEKESEALMNQQEIDEKMNGAFLTEAFAPDQPGVHRIRIDAYKGMKAEEMQAILDKQEEQRRQTQDKANQVKEVDKAWAKQSFWNNRAAVLLEREHGRMKKERDAMMVHENQLLASEFRQRKQFIDRVLYTNPVGQDYFTQFNTTSR